MSATVLLLCLQVRWHASLDAVPQEGPPAIYIAHEFFDALPVHQFIKDPARGWLEKMVDVADETAAAGPSKSDPEAGNAATDSDGASSSSSSNGRLLESADAVSGIVQSSRGSHAPPSSPLQMPSSSGKSTIRGPNGTSGDQQQQDPHHLRLVLSPRPTPASSLLVERRLAALGSEEAEKLTAIEVRSELLGE